jgi:hypothetical protein
MLSECIPTPAEAEWENIATKFLNLYLRKANFNTRKTYTDFRDWCDSSTTTGQLWVSFLTAYDSLLTPLFIITDRVALRNATMAIGRSRRPRGPTYARGANRSQFEDPELAVNARHLAARRAHPAFKFFYVAHSGSGKFQFRVICASHHGGAGRTHVTPANVRLRWPHASRLASCNLSSRTPLSLSLSLHFLFFSSQR